MAETSAPASNDADAFAQPPLRVEGKLNVYASVPCPLKVRFNESFEAALASLGAQAGTGVHCSNLLPGDKSDLAERLTCAESVEDLPDVIVTTRAATVLDPKFRSRFLDTGKLIGYIHAEERAGLPPELADVAERLNLGFLAFGGWSVVVDLSLAEGLDMPRSWADLADEKFRGLISIPGHGDEICGPNTLRVIEAKLGLEGVRRLARNTRLVKHFSELVKRIDSGMDERTPFSLLPDAVSAQIPSRKRAARLQWNDGPILMPIFQFVRRDRLEASRAALDFFRGPVFSGVMRIGDFHTPTQMDWADGWSYPDWDELLRQDYPAVTQALAAIFLAEQRAAWATPQTDIRTAACAS